MTNQQLVYALLYGLSIVITFIFGYTYYSRTWKNKQDRELLYYDREDNEKYFDFGFLKKVCLQLMTVFFTTFSFVNVFYFCINGSWISDGTFSVTRGFLIIGSIIYFFDLIEKSMAIIRDEKQKRKAKKPNNDKNPQT